LIPHEHLRDHAFHAFMSLISRTIVHAFPLRARLMHAMLNLCEFVKYSSDSASLNFGSDQTPFRDLFQHIVVLSAGAKDISTRLSFSGFSERTTV